MIDNQLFSQYFAEEYITEAKQTTDFINYLESDQSSLSSSDS